MRVYVDGAKVYQTTSLGSQDATFDVPNNLGAALPCRSRCATRSGACTQSSAQNVQTYGPLAPAHIHSITPTINVRSVSWTIEVDSNGDPATLTVTSDKGRSQEFTVPIGVSTFTTNAMEFGYQETETVTVTLADPSPARGPVSGTNSATHRAGPAADRRGVERCRLQRRPGHRPAALRHRTASAAASAPTRRARSCTSRSATGAPTSPAPPVYCSVNGEPGRPYDPNASTDTTDYYGSPGGTVTVYCENVLGQHAITQFTW